MEAGSLTFIDRFLSDKKRSNTRMGNYRPHSIVGYFVLLLEYQWDTLLSLRMQTYTFHVSQTIYNNRVYYEYNIVTHSNAQCPMPRDLAAISWPWPSSGRSLVVRPVADPF